jgi:hypothetical protein
MRIQEAKHNSQSAMQHRHNTLASTTHDSTKKTLKKGIQTQHNTYLLMIRYTLHKKRSLSVYRYAVDKCPCGSGIKQRLRGLR